MVNLINTAVPKYELCALETAHLAWRSVNIYVYICTEHIECNCKETCAYRSLTYLFICL